MAGKAQNTPTVVTLPEIDFRVVTVKIKGTTPLVTNPFPVKQRQQIEDKHKGKAKDKKHDILNEWENFIEAIYWLSGKPSEYSEAAFNEAVANGARYGFHAGGLKNSAIMAAYRRGVVKNAVTARGFFQIQGTEKDQTHNTQCIEIITPNPPIMRVDCLSTFNSGRDMRYRPQFDEWRMEFDVVYDAGAITLDQLLMWFKLGGFACGLGENRAEKGEGWGSYELDM
jgi:hypothetical protein